MTAPENPKPKRRKRTPPTTLVVDVTSRDPSEVAKQEAAAILRPSTKAGMTLQAWGTKPFAVGITELVGELRKEGERAAT